MLFAPQRRGSDGYEWWYLDVELANDLTLVAIVFDGFPFHPRATRSAAFQLDAYQRGKRVASVMAVDGSSALVDDGRVGAAGAELALANSGDGDDPGGRLTLSVNGWAAFPGVAVTGTMSLHGEGWTEPVPLRGWAPLFMRACAEVDIRFGSVRAVASGALAYADHNWGDAPLAREWSRWVWGRVHGAETTTVAYRSTPLDGEEVSLVACSDGKVDQVPVTLSGHRLPSVFGLGLPNTLTVGTERWSLGRPCLTAPFYVRVPTTPRGLAEIGRPSFASLPGFRHLVGMRMHRPGIDPPAGDRILHRFERRVLRRRRLRP